MIVAIVVIIVEKESHYCLVHGWQALFFWIVCIIGSIIFGIIDIFIPLGFGILAFLWSVTIIIVWIILMVTAWTRAPTGNPFLLPLIGPQAEKLATNKLGPNASGGGNTQQVAPQEQPDYTAPPPQPDV